MQTTQFTKLISKRVCIILLFIKKKKKKQVSWKTNENYKLIINENKHRTHGNIDFRLFIVRVNNIAAFGVCVSHAHCVPYKFFSNSCARYKSLLSVMYKQVFLAAAKVIEIPNL